MSGKNLFVDVRVDLERCIGIERCGKCVTMCPVKIFEESNERATSNKSRNDECTLCDVCLNECPVEAITVEKLY